MTDAPTNFLNLPWEIQVALASGYAAYATGYMGLRDRQRPIDIAFLSIVFSVPATLVLWWLFERSIYISAPAAFVAAIAVALIWRRLLRPLVFPILRKYDVTWSNDDPSALATLSGNSKFKVTQIAIHLDDDSWLCCDDLKQFEHAPFAPYVLGQNGDVALYLTQTVGADGNAKPQETVSHPEFGDRITYVPAARIKQIAIRHTSKFNRVSTEAVSPVAAETVEPLESEQA
jgi:hypothetical protein